MASPECPIGFVTDSTVSLSPREAKNLRVQTGIPIIVTSSGIKLHGRYVRDLSLGTGEFYGLLKAEGYHDTTHVNPGDLTRAYTALIEQFGVREILSFHSDSRLTGGINSAVIASSLIAEKHPDVKIHVLDTQTASAGAGILILEALERAKQGMSMEENIRLFEEDKRRIHFLFAVTNAAYLVNYAANRLDTKFLAGALAIGLLKIYPILELAEGKLNSKKKIRKRSNIQAELANSIDTESTRRAIVVHTNCPEEAKQLAELLSNQLGMPIPTWEAGGVLANYAGEGGLGVAFLNK